MDSCKPVWSVVVCFFYPVPRQLKKEKNDLSANANFFFFFYSARLTKTLGSNTKSCYIGVLPFEIVDKFIARSRDIRLSSNKNANETML